MKRALILFVLAAAMLGLWQRHRLDQLNQRQTTLAAQISEAKGVLAAARKTPPAAGSKATSNSSGPATATRETKPLRVDEFFDLAGELSRLETDTTPGGDRRRFQEKVTALFGRLPATPAAQLRAIMEKLPASGVSAKGKEQASMAIIDILAKSDPAAAAAYALQYKPQPRTVEVALRAWARQDAAASAAWLDQAEAAGTLPPSLKADQLRLILLPHQIAADPGGAAMDQMVRLQPANLDEIFGETARLLTTPDQRRAFLQRLTTVPGLPAEAVGQFLHQVGRESSIGAAINLLREVGSALPPAQFDAAAVATATARIDASTPVQAEWLLQNLRGPDREPAITTLIQAWTQADYNAAAAWLQHQPASADHDTAIAAFAQFVSAKEPPSAVDWASAIGDSTRKAAVLASLYRSWHAQSPQDAADYFQKKGLTPQ